MTESSQRLIVYDGNCSVCSRAADRLRGRKWTSPHRVIAFQDLPPEQAETMQAAGIEKQMLLHDPISGRTVGGMEAIHEMQVASGKKITAWLLGVPGISHLAGLAYRVFAANRRMFSPVQGGIQCDCDPEPTPSERLAAFLVVIVPMAIMGLLLLRLGIGPIVLGLIVMWVVPSVFLSPVKRVVAVGDQLAVGLSIGALAGLVAWMILLTGARVAAQSASSSAQVWTLAVVSWCVGAWAVRRRMKSLGEEKFLVTWTVATFLIWIGLLLGSQLY